MLNMPNKVIITEKQYKKLILDEGYTLSKHDDKSVNLSFNNQDFSNNANKLADTRIFSNRNDIAYGNAPNDSNSLMNKKLLTQKEIERCKGIIKLINNKNLDDIKQSNLLKDNERNKLLSLDWSDDNEIYEMVSFYENRIDKLTTNLNAYDSMWMQASKLSQSVNQNANMDGNDKITKFFVGTVPNSGGIKYISLFTMNSFTMNTALKHGHINATQDNLKPFNMLTKKQFKDTTGNDDINVYFDNVLNGKRKQKDNYVDNSATMEKLFSMHNLNGSNDHYRQNYDMGNISDETNTYSNFNNGYTTSQEFIDKSIMYASYALRKENFRPRIIVCAPSSSQFNKLYCKRLANNINAEFVDNFFKQSLLTTKFNESEMIADGITMTDKERLSIDSYAIGAVKRGINQEWNKIINSFLKKKSGTLYKISIKYNTSMEGMKIDIIKYIKRQISDFYKNIRENTAQYISDYLIENIKHTGFSRENKEALTYFVTSNLVIKDLSIVIKEMEDLFINYAKQLNSNGISITLSDKQYKIIGISSRFRKYLQDMYVVATDELKNNGTKSIGFYRNSNILMFDEDMGTGTTLKLALDGLRNFKNNMTASNTMCLVNAFSFAGK